MARSAVCWNLCRTIFSLTRVFNWSQRQVRVSLKIITITVKLPPLVTTALLPYNWRSIEPPTGWSVKHSSLSAANIAHCTYRLRVSRRYQFQWPAWIQQATHAISGNAPWKAATKYKGRVTQRVSRTLANIGTQPIYPSPKRNYVKIVQHSTVFSPPLTNQPDRSPVSLPKRITLRRIHYGLFATGCAIN